MLAIGEVKVIIKPNIGKWNSFGAYFEKNMNFMQSE